MDLSTLLQTINYYLDYFSKYVMCIKNNHYYQNVDDNDNDIEYNFQMQR